VSAGMEKDLSAGRALHAEERQAAILAFLRLRGFISFRELEQEVPASPATLRRDLDRLAEEGCLERVHGGARLASTSPLRMDVAPNGLQGVPFRENVDRFPSQKQAIGQLAATLCSPGEAIMIDGGSTTLQMCPHLGGRSLQVLTNSLHIVSTLLVMSDIRVLVPGGSVFREQNIILSADGEEVMPHFFAPKLFMGASAVGPQGVMQPDVVLVAAERRFIARAEKVILLVDSSKFEGPSGHVVCPLSDLHTVITDAGISRHSVNMLTDAGVEVLIAS
jgi:DeoR family transcriptional regulator, ulaG and ulaABCDEF operon transcriptional repressor